ncbi:RNA helicase, partial [Tulasnella sp. 419]
MHVVSGTPGRMFDLIRRRNLCTENINILVLNRAEELNSMLKTHIYGIHRCLSTSTQVAIITATLPPDLQEMVTKCMSEPIQILAKRDELTLEGIKQFYIQVEEEWKYDLIHQLWDRMQSARAIIYCNTPCKVNWLSGKLREANIPILSMHGDMEQEELKAVINDFRSNSTHALIVAAVWSCSSDVSVVINYDMP